MINFIPWLVFGAMVGWLASMITRTTSQQGVLRNILLGIVGAFLGSYLFNLIGLTGSTIATSDFSPPVLLISFIGAAFLLAIVNLVHHDRVHFYQPKPIQSVGQQTP